MSRVVGSEVSAYRAAVAPTGVPRVVKETHRHLGPGLASHGISLVPLVTRSEQREATVEPSRYAIDDPVLAAPLTSPEQVDAVLLLDPGAPIDFARLLRARRERGLLILAMINDLLPIEHPEWFPPGADRHYRVLVQQILHVANHLIVPSRSVAESLGSLGWRMGPDVHVVPLGSAFAQLPPAPVLTDRVNIVYVSTVEPRKGHRQLLEAFDLLREQEGDVRLTLLGRIGWESDELVRSIQSHPEFGASLQWIRHAHDLAVRELLQQGAVAVMPTEGEGFGLFLEEALTAGVHVVASDLAVLRERPYPNVSFVDNSADSLASGIRDAAHGAPVALAPGTVRSMASFSRELENIIIDSLGP